MDGGDRHQRLPPQLQDPLRTGEPVMSVGVLDSRNLNGGQKLAVKYFIVAMVLFVAQILFGLLAAVQFIVPGFLFETLDFSVNRMLHINAMVVWMLYGFIG